MHLQGLAHQPLKARQLLVDEQAAARLGIWQLQHAAKGQLGDLEAAARLLGIDARSVIGRLGGEALHPGYLPLRFELLGVIQMVGQPLFDLLFGLHHLSSQHHAEIGLGEALEGGLLLEHQQLLRLAHLRLADILRRIDATTGKQRPEHLDRAGHHILFGQGGDKCVGPDPEQAAERQDQIFLLGQRIEIEGIKFNRLIEVGIAGPQIHFGQIHVLGRLAQLLGPIDPGLLGSQPFILLDDPGPGFAKTDGLRLRRPQHGTHQTRPE